MRGIVGDLRSLGLVLVLDTALFWRMSIQYTISDRYLYHDRIPLICCFYNPQNRQSDLQLSIQETTSFIIFLSSHLA